MKTRNGFVSNSSSSSFIVAFDTVPTSAKELQSMLFGEQEYYPDPYPCEHVGWDAWSCQEIAEIVFRDMKDGPSAMVFMIDTIENGWFEGCPDWDNFKIDKKDGSRIDWSAYNKAREDHAVEVLSDFQNDHPGCNFFTFEYSDNDGSLGSAMEHGNLFSKVPHLCISHH